MKFFCRQKTDGKLDCMSYICYYIYNRYAAKQRKSALQLFSYKKAAEADIRLTITKEGGFMVIKIDFQSEEALYMQLRNQIILGIATSMIQEGDSLPSVRQLADDIGINMHTVNKAYSLLRQEGFLTIDRRKGAVIALDIDKMEALNEIKKNLKVILAKAHCKDISADEVHALVDEIFSEYEPL